MDELIITENELIKPSHWPVSVAFGSYKNTNPGFIRIAENLAEGNGYLINDEGIIFWDDLDDFEKEHNDKFDIECIALDSYCNLSFKEFFQYFKRACVNYSKENSKMSEYLELKLEMFKLKFLSL